MSDDCKKRLREMVLGIVKDIENGFDEDDLNSDGEPMTAMDYLIDCLDIEYIVNGSREYLGARVLVAFGGPNIWIDTRHNQVEGYWWNDTFIQSYYRDEMELDDSLKELWDCM